MQNYAQIENIIIIIIDLLTWWFIDLVVYRFNDLLIY